MRFRKKLLSVLLGGLLIASTACSGAAPEEKPEGDAAMGRYIEEQWQLPTDSYGLAGPMLLPDGRVAALAFDEDGTRLFTTRDGAGWQEETPRWFTDMVEQNRMVVDFHFLADGRGVFLHQGEDPLTGEYTYEVGLIHPDGSWDPTPIGKLPKRDFDVSQTIRVRESVKESLENPNPAGFYDVELNVDGEPPEEEGRQEGEPASIEITSAAADDGGEPVEDVPEETDASSVGESAGAVTLGEEGADADGEEAEYDMFYIQSVLLGQDGLVYTGTFDAAEVYDPQTGEFLRSYPYGNSTAVAGGRVAQTLYPDSYDPEKLGFDVTANTVALYREGEAPELVDAPMLTSSEYGSDILYGAADGALYLTTPRGIYRMAPGGDLWERVVDGDLTSLSLPSSRIVKMVVHGDNEFLVCIYGEKASLLNYRYSPDTPSRPDKELIVYTLGENRFLQQAAGVFRQTNPGAVVSIHNLMEEGSSATQDDAIRALNTELLAGKGPDLLLLDGMPVESYIEKGVLVNLTDLLRPMVEQGELLENVVSAFEKNGSIYAVPARFALPSVWGEENAVAAASSLRALADYAQAHPELRMFHDMRPSVLFQDFAPVSQGEWLRDGGVDAEALARFLEDIDRLARTDGGKASLTPEDAEIGFSSARLRERENIFNDLLSVATKETDLMINYLQGFQSLMEPNGAIYTREGKGAELLSSDQRAEISPELVDKVFRPLAGAEQGYYLPQAVIGVNAGSSQQELAKEFVSAALSLESQRADLEDGFPVNAHAVAEGRTKMVETYMTFTTVDESGIYRSVVMGWPSERMLGAVVDTFGSLATPVVANEALMEMVLEEAHAFFSGGATARQAADAVAQRARLMLAE